MINNGNDWGKILKGRRLMIPQGNRQGSASAKG
jgi:hypothetical protein